jgi:hypothetical protein
MGFSRKTIHGRIKQQQYLTERARIPPTIDFAALARVFDRPEE